MSRHVCRPEYPRLLTESADLWQHWLYVAVLENNGLQEAKLKMGIIIGKYEVKKPRPLDFMVQPARSALCYPSEPGHLNQSADLYKTLTIQLWGSCIKSREKLWPIGLDYFVSYSLVESYSWQESNKMLSFLSSLRIKFKDALNLTCCWLYCGRAQHFWWSLHIDAQT